MRTITNLYNEADVVFIKVRHEAAAKKLWKDALEEGFLVEGKSELKDIKMRDTVYRLESNHKLHSISGFASHMFYGSLCKENDGKSIVRIDYSKYINGYDDYRITERKDLWKTTALSTNFQL